MAICAILGMYGTGGDDVSYMLGALKKEVLSVISLLISLLNIPVLGSWDEK